MNKFFVLVVKSFSFPFTIEKSSLNLVNFIEEKYYNILYWGGLI